jgi:hypothetical protein
MWKHGENYHHRGWRVRKVAQDRLGRLYELVGPRDSDVTAWVSTLAEAREFINDREEVRKARARLWGG